MYFFEDAGLRDIRLGFRQQEENHVMENVIYNELRYRGFSVDVGIVEIRTIIRKRNGNNSGITTVGIRKFLLDENSLEW